MKELSDVSKKIKELIDKDNISYTHLAKATGITVSNISDWLNGRSSPKLEAVTKIADYFNISVDYFLGRDIPQQSPTDYSKNVVTMIGKGGKAVTYELEDEDRLAIERMLEALNKKK